MNTQFQRENRYIVIKRRDAYAALSEWQLGALNSMVEKVETTRRLNKKADLICVVIESDWPEYEPTWAAIEARMTMPPPKPTQGAEKGEPILLNDKIWEAIYHHKSFDDLGANRCSIISAIATRIATAHFAPLAEPAQAGRTDAERLDHLLAGKPVRIADGLEAFHVSMLYHKTTRADVDASMGDSK